MGRQGQDKEQRKKKISLHQIDSMAAQQDIIQAIWYNDIHDPVLKG